MRVDAVACGGVCCWLARRLTRGAVKQVGDGWNALLPHTPSGASAVGCKGVPVGLSRAIHALQFMTVLRSGIHWLLPWRCTPEAATAGGRLVCVSSRVGRVTIRTRVSFVPRGHPLDRWPPYSHGNPKLLLALRHLVLQRGQEALLTVALRSNDKRHPTHNHHAAPIR